MHYRFAFYVLRRVLVHVISVLLLKIILPSRIPAVILFIKFLVFSMQVRFTDDIDDILFFYVTLLEECMTIIQTQRSTLPLKYLMYSICMFYPYFFPHCTDASFLTIYN